MSRAAFATVSVDVDCALHQFDDDDVLAYAADLVKDHKGTKEPPEGDRRREAWRATDALVEKLALALGLPQATDSTYPYPPSTAASITTIEGLRALMKPSEGAH